jgi:hypothetical protein
MVSRKVVVSTLVVINVACVFFVLSRYDAYSINTWLLLFSLAAMSVAIYRVVGMVEGYK